MFETPVHDLDAAETSALLSECIGEETWAQDRQLILAVHFASLYPPEKLSKSGSRRLALVGERPVRIGGAGTPLVAEFAPDELAPEIGLSIYQARNLMADALDLRYRFPGLWQLVLRGEAPGPTVRSVARKTRDLSLVQTKIIDRMLAQKLLAVPRGRFETLLDAAILRVDADRVAKRVEGAAMVDRIADILMSSPKPIHGVAYRNAKTPDEWRAVAFGVLRNPLLASKILIEHTQPDLFEEYAAAYQPPPGSIIEPDRPVDDDHGIDHDQEAPEYEPDPDER